jgi:AhpD family alkylhydroperoxidase
MARISLDPPRTLSYRIAEWFVRRRFGDMMDPVRAVAHNRRVSRATALFELLVLRWNTVPHRLKDLAVMAAAVRIGCSWCVDFGTWESHTHGVSLAKLKAVPRWRESELFTEEERLVMAYAEAMTTDPPEVTDEMVDGLRGFLTEPQLVELTMIIAVENMRSRFNAAAGLAGQGFKDRCEIPAGQGMAS